MEYYKDEATRARDIAIKKFLANDISGARKFAVKAQFLYPELDGITQTVATFDIHLSAQNMISGEIDHYRILNLKPEADEDTAEKRYRKLVELLSPDKNKSVGGEEAFKFVSEAWNVLRADYELKRNVGSHEGGGGSSSSKPPNKRVQKVTKTRKKVKSSKRVIKQASDASAAATAFTVATASAASAATASTASATAAATVFAAATATASADGTFRTVCRNCSVQYEHYRVHLNRNLMCGHCHQPFRVVETVWYN